MPQLSLGIDYGTNSCRALLVDVATGEELATGVYEYPSGEAGILLDPRDPNLARQNPQDYLDGFDATVREVLKGVDPADVIGIGVDTTGSSPMPIDRKANALSSHERFKDDLAAFCWLWKDHTSVAEAEEITANPHFARALAKCGGRYSSEWFWAKILRCARVAPEVFAAAHSWAEICDWIPARICGVTDPAEIVRSRCAAGHKAMFADEWGGLPSKKALASLDPCLADLRDRLYAETRTSDAIAGRVSAETAARTGLREGTPVAVGAFDAHFGAVASGAKPGTLVKIMGTSTCDCMAHPLTDDLPDVPGLCGIVRGSVLPDCWGLEAGQSAVGDLFNWVVRLTGRSHEDLTEAGLRSKPGASGLLALDWNNGNRTVLVDTALTGLLVGQTLYTTPAEMYRAVVEATAFGALTIIERFEAYGVTVQEVVNCGGIAEKSAFVMQIYADVCDRPMKVSRSAQTCALGSAIFGAVVGGAYATAEEAQRTMTGVKDRVYTPVPENVAVYKRLYALYMQLHDALGTAEWTGSMANVMKDLLAIREAART